MIEKFFADREDADLVKGLVAGVAGGLLASLVMEQFQLLWSKASEAIERARETEKPRGRKADPSTVKVAQAISKSVFGKKIPKSKKRLAGEAVHYAMGATSGAIYGAAVEALPVYNRRRRSRVRDRALGIGGRSLRARAAIIETTDKNSGVDTYLRPRLSSRLRMDDRDGAPCRTASVVRHVVRSAMALAFLLSMNPISFAQNSGAVRETKTSFASGGKKIAVKIFAPEAGANGGGVLVLHGAGGMLMDGPAIHRFARALAQNGFESFVIHYFDRTGSVFARDASIHKNFDTWRAAVKLRRVSCGSEKDWLLWLLVRRISLARAGSARSAHRRCGGTGWRNRLGTCRYRETPAANFDSAWRDRSARAIGKCTSSRKTFAAARCSARKEDLSW